ncbi:reverse transcriptase zinc-binding domain-containing protein [Tanacetum coccineum]
MLDTLLFFWKRKATFPVLQQIQVPNLHDNVSDEAVWVTRTGKETKFVTKSVWKDMCSNEPKVIWNSVVWFSQCVLKHSFVLWIAVQSRLMTQDKVLVWKPNEIMKCAFCSQCPDSIEHLFFTCAYSKSIWDDMQMLLNRRLSHNWNNMIDESTRMATNNNIWSIMRRLVIGAVVYYIWQERNERLFKKQKRDVKILVQLVTETIKIRMMSFRVKESNAVKDVEMRCNVKLKRSSLASM